MVFRCLFNFTKKSKTQENAITNLFSVLIHSDICSVLSNCKYKNEFQIITLKPHSFLLFFDIMKEGNE